MVIQVDMFVKILIHLNPSNLYSLSPQASPGWYLGPSLHHYRCATVLHSTSNRVIINDSFAFHPNNSFPVTTPSDHLTNTPKNINTIITTKNIHPSITTPHSPQHAATQKLITIISHKKTHHIPRLSNP